MGNITQTQQLDNWQGGLMLARQIELSLSLIVLIVMLVDLCIRKLYVYNTTKLFMLAVICYIVGLSAVLFMHFPAIAKPGPKYVFVEDRCGAEENYFIRVLADMKETSAKFALCGLEAMINLLFYDLGYFFTMLISYNLMCIINDNHRNLMRRIFKSKFTLSILFVIIALYLVPFIMLWTQKYQLETNSTTFSYGPTGFNIIYDGPTSCVAKNPPHQGDLPVVKMLFFCGNYANNESTWSKFLSVLVTNIAPIALFIIHLGILLKIRVNEKELFNQDYLNEKQKFIAKSGKLGRASFFIQLFNLLKLILSLVPSTSNIYNWALIVINFIFDLYPFALLYLFRRFTKEKRGLPHGSSTLLSQ